ncbi:hypothetical protein [Bacillus kwashiorkori]|uniref:hypothetical protein n=1 Tax=Bacillus kwashiorkori TaxID=1522318 RepID=UPI000981766B|nr:hypothetical protein [Bacillus kwashiorkori]
MFGYFIDFSLTFSFIILTTAFLGVILNFFGKLLFGKNKHEYLKQMEAIQAGWKQVGGNSNHR